MVRPVLSMRKTWTEGKHPRDGAGKFASAPDTGMNPPGRGSGKRPVNLKDSIHAILHGSPEEKKKLRQSFFHLADTPRFMKDKGLRGDYFSVKYGVIVRHDNKDADHNLSEQNWIDLCDKIKEPGIITRHGEGFRLFTGVKVNGRYVVVGVDVKNAGKTLAVNAVSTAFGYRDRPITDEVVYIAKKLSPDQKALLGRPDSSSYPPDQGLMSTVSPKTLKKSSPRLVIKREISRILVKKEGKQKWNGQRLI